MAPTVGRPGGWLGSRGGPAHGEGEWQGRRQESRQAPGMPPTPGWRQPLSPPSVRKSSNHSKPGLELVGTEVETIRAGKSNCAMAFCLIRSGELAAAQRSISPHSPRQRLLQPRAAAHPQVAGPPPRDDKLAQFALDQEGAHLDPAHLPPQGIVDQAHHRAWPRAASCTTSRQGRAPRKDAAGKCVKPWPGFSPPALAIPL